MKWYLKFWFHNWRARIWKRRASVANYHRACAETHQWRHEGEWTTMKNRLKEFPK